MTSALETAKSNNSIQSGNAQAGTNIAATIYELASRFQTPLMPENFKTWYDYVTGDNAVLTERIDRLTRNNKSFNPSEFKQLHAEYTDTALGPDAHSSALHTELKSIMGAVNGYLNSSNEYTNSLKKVDAEISDTSTPPDFKSIVSALLEENTKIRQQAASAYESLEKSQESIEQIRTELQETQDEAMKDPLTKIGNRKCFDVSLSSGLLEAENTGKPFCLAIADLDKFKLLNDNYGHLVGDAVLKYFSSLMKELVKEPQVAARFGGEEFAFILPNTNIEDATILVEKLRVQLEISNLVTINNREPIGTVTASFGISAFISGDTPATITERADKLLYKAKEDGRNRICI